MREGKRKGHREFNDYEFMMQAPRRVRISDYVRSRAITYVHECLCAYTSVYLRLRAYASDYMRSQAIVCVHERFLQNFSKSEYQFVDG